MANEITNYGTQLQGVIGQLNPRLLAIQGSSNIVTASGLIDESLMDLSLVATYLTAFNEDADTRLEALTNSDRAAARLPMAQGTAQEIHGLLVSLDEDIGLINDVATPAVQRNLLIAGVTTRAEVIKSWMSEVKRSNTAFKAAI